MRTKRSSAQMRIAGQMKYESLPGVLALLLVSGSWTYSIFDVWTYAPASMILGDGRSVVRAHGESGTYMTVAKWA